MIEEATAESLDELDDFILWIWVVPSGAALICGSFVRGVLADSVVMTKTLSPFRHFFQWTS